MAELSDLKQSISELSDAELVEHFRQIRLNRRTPPIRKVTQKVRDKAKATAALPKTSELTPEAAAELLKRLTGA